MFGTLFLTAFLISADPQPVRVTPEVAAKLREIAFQSAREGDTVTLNEYFATGFGANEPNGRGDTLLTVAAYNGQMKAVEAILKQPKVTVDARNKMGLTALTAASFKGHLDIAKALIAAKADVNAANSSKQTALMFAALAGRTEMVDYLIEVGADIEARDTAGNTATTLAEKQGAKAIVEKLKAAGQRKK